MSLDAEGAAEQLMEELHFPDLLFRDLPELVDVGVGGEMWISSSDAAISTSPVAMIAVASQAAPTSKDVAAGQKTNRRPKSLRQLPAASVVRWEPRLPSTCLKDSPPFPRRVD